MSNYSIDYAGTLTLRPKLFVHTPEQQIDLARTEIKVCLRTLCAQYTCIAELTKSYNIHFHLICKVLMLGQKNTLRKLYDCFRKSTIIGFCVWKPVTEYKVWTDYMTKDTIKTYSELFCQHPVIQNDYMIPFMLNECSPLECEESECHQLESDIQI